MAPVTSDRRRARKVEFRNGIALVGAELEPRAFATLPVTDGVIGELDGAPGGGQVGVSLDLAGAFVVPGLIDCHVHFDLAAHPAAYAHYDASPVIRSLTCLHNGLAALRSGITTVRDLGSADHLVLDYAALVNRGLVVGPRVVAAGRPITVRGGHFSEYARVADGPADVREAVREQVAAGARVIKVMATGGISTAGDPRASQLTLEEMCAAVEEAHKHGLKVAAHAHTHAGVLSALAAGVDSIEHAAFAKDETFKAMLEHKTTLVPTVSALNRIGPNLGIPPDTVRKSVEARQPYLESTRKAIGSGVNIVAGTDAGTALNPIGGLVDELVMYCDAGMTGRQALATSTARAGALLGGGLGVLEAGRPADLVVVADDPREDVATLRHPLHVVKAGRLLDMAWAERTMSELSEILAGD